MRLKRLRFNLNNWRNPMNQRLPLEFLGPGEEGHIAEIEGGVEAANRLREMGLREGARVRMVRTGATCIIAVDHHRFSFRGEEAATVFVEPVNGVHRNGSE